MDVLEVILEWSHLMVRPEPHASSGHALLQSDGIRWYGVSYYGLAESSANEESDSERPVGDVAPCGCGDSWQLSSMLWIANTMHAHEQ